MRGCRMSDVGRPASGVGRRGAGVDESVAELKPMLWPLGLVL